MRYQKHRRIFLDKMEDNQSDHCTNSSRQHYGLSVEKVKSLAYDFADQNNIDIANSWWQNRKAEKDWFEAFMVCHKLTLRSPEAVSLEKAMSFNREAETLFF